MREHLLKEVEACRNRLAQIEFERSKLLGRIEGLEYALNHYQNGGGPAAVAESRKQPGPPRSPKDLAAKEKWDEAIQDMHNTGGEITVGRAMQKLHALGHNIKRGSVRSKLSELRAAGVLEKIAEGRYRFPVTN